MTERAAQYVNNTATSYRKGVCTANLPIFYAQRHADKFEQRGRTDAVLNLAAVAHTSLFRWVTTLGEDVVEQPETLRADFTPASHKYTSEQRRSILIACRAACSIPLADRAPAAKPC